MGQDGSLPLAQVFTRLDRLPNCPEYKVIAVDVAEAGAMSATKMYQPFSGFWPPLKSDVPPEL